MMIGVPCWVGWFALLRKEWLMNFENNSQGR
jgi:hypothetical protein